MLISLALLACSSSVAPTAVKPAPLDRDTWNDRAALLAPHHYKLDDGDPLWVWHGGLPDGAVLDGDLDVVEPADARQKLVAQELERGRRTPIVTKVAAAERPFVEAMLEVGNAIEALHALQRGSAAIVPADDPYSRSLFWRNQGPWCEELDDPGCHATPTPVDRVVGVYPAPIQATEDFCATLEAHEPSVMDPFTVVRGEPGAWTGVPYSQAWPTESARVAAALERAAAKLPASEAPLSAYLRAAATAFVDDSWEAADRAWVETRERSAWYVRVGPDETYWDPCDRKAGYHLVFARINPGSLAWQQKLEPVKLAMEQAIAAKAAPYTARDVAFSLPEFIDIVLNAGDSRSALGATTGQSLPNWGPVAEAGGRTVAMTNLNVDADSRSTLRSRAASMFCELDVYTDSPEPLLVSTVLHEAAHNLGPASGYTVDGKTDEDAFGGELASMMEELKAQTAAMYLTDWLVPQGVLTADFAKQAHMADLVWVLGQISQGMQDSEGNANTYPQLSAVQLGVLMELGAIRWEAEKLAANGTDTGCLAVDHAALPAAVEQLADRVFSLKGKADAEGARALQNAHVPGPHGPLFATIEARWNRGPSPSFVYAFRF